MASDLQGDRFGSRPLDLTVQALTLLEYLVKHGSERVVDDARSHISTVKMLKSFHYIDEKGKDQGING
jgi:epsin